jgi:hypothetical protein
MRLCCHLAMVKPALTPFGQSHPPASPALSTHPPTHTHRRWVPFANAARSDGLELCHWANVAAEPYPSAEAAGKTPVYPFVKYNRTLDLLQYSNQEYTDFLKGILRACVAVCGSSGRVPP